MQRLREQTDASDPVLAEAGRLLRAARPLAVSAARKRRVLAAIQRRADGRGRAVWLRLQPALIVLLVLGSVAFASAMLGRGWNGHRPGRTVAPPASSAPPGVPVPTTALPSAPAVDRSPALPSAPAADRAPAPRVRQSGPPRPVHREVRAPTGDTAAPVRQPPPEVPAPSAATTPGPSSHEAAMVLAAVKALRRDHDPARAGVLLDDYLRLYPSGVLVEEALALAIEAAAQRGDESAGDLGAQYLRRFPTGRFREAARRAQQRFGD